MRVGAIVLMYDHWPGPALDALVAQTHPLEHVLLIDNASPEDLTEQLRSEYPRVSVIRLGRNGGYASGMNTGIVQLGRLDVDAFLLLTHECELEPKALGHLVSALERHPKAGIVGPLLGELQDPDRVFSAGGLMADVYGGVKHRREPAAISAWSKHASPVAADWLDGACLLVRRSVVVEAGLLDERFFLYFEDVEYSLRVKDAGYDVACVPQAVARQSAGGGTTPLVTARNGLLLLLSRGAATPVLFRHIAGSFVWAVIRRRPLRAAPRRLLRWLRALCSALVLHSRSDPPRGVTQSEGRGVTQALGQRQSIEPEGQQWSILR